MSNTGHVWGIFLSPGRRVRTTMQAHNEVLFVNMKVFETGIKKPYQSISMTLAELMQIPSKLINLASIYDSWVVYNGTRKRCITFDDETELISMEIMQNKSGQWESRGCVNLEKNEFSMFQSIPMINLIYKHDLNLKVIKQQQQNNKIGSVVVSTKCCALNGHHQISSSIFGQGAHIPSQ